MMQDYKILMINAGSFGISMTNIDVTLKIVFITCNYRIYNTKMVFTKQKQKKIILIKL